MRGWLIGAVVLLAMHMPGVAALTLGRDGAQRTTEDKRQAPTEPPAVTAGTSEWRLNNEPIFVAGDFYEPAGPNVFFDGWTMAKIDTYRGVPVYTDTTLEPSTVVFVPIGGLLMKRYERRRTGVAIGPVESATPSIPVEAASSLVETGSPATGDVTKSPPGAAPRTDVQTIPRPLANEGIWIEFAGKKWRASGVSRRLPAKRLVIVGRYHGFPVYQDPARSGEIYVPAIKGGSVAVGYRLRG